MKAPEQKDTVAVTPAPERDEQARREPTSNGSAVELSGEAVEERIVPKLAANHNETLLEG